MTELQLALNLAGPAHERGVDFDFAQAALVAQQERVLEAATRERHTASPCACPTPWLEGRSHCTKCGREVAR